MEKLKKIYSFGCFHGLIYTLFVISLRLFPKSRFSQLIRELHDFAVKRFIKRKLLKKNFISENNYIPNNDISPIWFLWWQGINDMPTIINACYNSIKKNANKHPVILLERSNIDKYIDIPHKIIERVKENKCSYTHLSDYIRFSLLYNHGGIWVDSTILVTSNIDTILNKQFTVNTFGLPYVPNKGGKWNIFFLSLHKGNLLSKYLMTLWELYWSKYDYLIDYFFTDYCISVLYETVHPIRTLIDSNYNQTLNYSDYDSHSLLFRLNETFDEKVFNEIISTVTIHKLKRQGQLNTQISNKQTFYGYIISKYKSII